ncbi:MAG: NAD(P)H-hydrate dehydratase [Motiliproteus sp.]
MSFLPPASDSALYTAEQTRQLDRCAIENHGIDGFELMQRAARAAYRAIRQRWPQLRSLTLLCGSGNNGGDAMVMAGLAVDPDQQGGPLLVQVLLLGAETTRTKLQGEAAQALKWAEARGVIVEGYGQQPLTGELLVDGLLGTGLNGPVSDAAAALIKKVNQSGKPVVALDLPSGLCADSGAVLGVAVRADLTVSFIGLNRGLLTHQGVDHCGELVLESLDIPAAVYTEVATDVDLIGGSQRLARRPRSAHKGDFGHLLVVGGDRGMAGAVMMASAAALRCGAGLVSVATQPEHVMLCIGNQPEVMSHGVRSGQELELLLWRASVIVIGPGLGQSAWSGQLLQAAQAEQIDQPLIIDADALNGLARGKLVQPSKRDNWILTPHPGEAARLLNCSVAQIQADRFEAVKLLQQRYGGVVVLKGAGTLICDGNNIRLCCRGNPGMASGGMGDVLSGVIAAVLGQMAGRTSGESSADGSADSSIARSMLFDAASVAVNLHAQAADLLAQRHGEIGLAATDLIPQIRALLNGIEE